MTISIDGIAVEIIRKNIKTLRLSVSPKDGKARVSAPRFLSQSIITGFVTSKKDWITARQLAYAKAAADALTTVRIWGQALPLQTASGQKAEYTLHGGFVLLTKPDGISDAALAARLDSFYKAMLQERIAYRLPILQDKVGLQCSAYRIRKMTSRWGSCNTKTKGITLALNLAKHPLECLDYVIIHELLHLSIPNHGSEYKALLSRHCPNWKSLKKQLNS